MPHTHPFDQHPSSRAHLAFSPVKLLGKGGEGEVYLVKDPQSGKKYVHKAFKKPLGIASGEALKILSSCYQPNEFGLAQLSLIWENNQLVGLYYPFEDLHTLHYRILKHSQAFAQTMLSAYCRLQSYLLSTYRVVITDTVSDHFLLDTTGRFHYIDYGISVKPADHPRVCTHGLLEYGLAMMLVNVYNNNLKREIRPLTGYRTPQAHAYFNTQRLQGVAQQQPWVGALLARLTDSEPECFFQPDFYLDLVDGFPTQVRNPQAVILLSRLIYRL